MIFKQGDIVKLAHEQGGYLPAVVISRKIFNKKTGRLIVCPIINTDKVYPTRVLIENQKTQGFIICENIKTIDVKAKNPKFIEHLNEMTLSRTLVIVNSEMQKDF